LNYLGLRFFLQEDNEKKKYRPGNGMWFADPKIKEG
jgi:hypothetical protein